LGQQLAEQARQWVGVPYVHRGARRSGCDCTGLLIGCLRELGYARTYKLRNYPRDWNLHALADDYIRQELSRYASPAEGGACVGDILLFRFGKCIAHAGIVVKPGVFVHTHARANRTETGLLKTPKWKARLAAVWRLDAEKVRALDG
jgi:cell wall-associated NlpC family hydrolase